MRIKQYLYLMPLLFLYPKNLNLIIFLITFTFSLCIKSIFTSIFILLAFNPDFIYLLIINCVLTLIIISPIKKRITLRLNKNQQELQVISCGGLVSFFKIHKNNIQNFETILKDTSSARNLINQDKLFLENKNINIEDRCILMREAHFMETFLQENKKLCTVWNSLLKEISMTWDMQDSSGNISSIYNSFLENQVIDGAKIFFLSRSLPIIHIHKKIPQHFKLQLQYIDSKGKTIQLTPDCIATNANTINLNSENIIDIKSHFWDFAKGQFFNQKYCSRRHHIEYTLIHYTPTSHEKLTNYICTTNSYVESGALIYCPFLNSILEAKREILPISGTESLGWYNFVTNSFKPFKDIIFP
jgi:hypothetical protein